MSRASAERVRLEQYEEESLERLRGLDKLRATDNGTRPSIAADVFRQRIAKLQRILGDDAPFTGPGRTFAYMINRSEDWVSKRCMGHRAVPDWAWLVLNCLNALAECENPEAVRRAVLGHVEERKRKAQRSGKRDTLAEKWQEAGLDP